MFKANDQKIAEQLQRYVDNATSGGGRFFCHYHGRTSSYDSKPISRFEYNEKGRLIKLHLCELQLTQFPPEVWRFSALQKLYLNKNKIRILPAEVGKLPALQKLDLSSNELSMLPIEVGNLSSLQKLHLYGNQLSSLPGTIGNLSALEELQLGSNRLSSVPEQIGNLSALEELQLYSNRLSSLPEEIGNLSALRVLDLSNNQLSNLPRQVGKLSNLESLCLTTNKLNSLPEEIGNLSALQVLRLNLNELRSLPVEMGKLLALQTLRLDGNPFLSSLPVEIGNLSKLQALYLDSVLVQQLPGLSSTEMKDVLSYLRQCAFQQKLSILVDAPSSSLEDNLPNSKNAAMATGIQASLLIERSDAENVLVEKETSLPGVTEILPSLASEVRPDRLAGDISSEEIARKKSGENIIGPSPLKIFYCYAHEDKDLRDRIDKHLGVLKRLGHIVGWYDREIQAGTEWEREIAENLGAAHIILLLVSADFVTSDYCYSVEMVKALELHRTGQARVLPILLRPVDWQDAPFAALQMLPTGAKPVTTWNNQDEALEDVARAIRAVVSSLRSQKK